MIRKIIKIDEEKCDGCGLCAEACHENAIVIENGKAKLIRDDYCDGLGDCLPACPAGAISFEEREAAPYDDEAVKASQRELVREKEARETREETPAACPSSMPHRMPVGGCPGSRMRDILAERGRGPVRAPEENEPGSPMSELAQWPVQIKLIPVNSPCFTGAHLLIAADCTAFACGDFHRRFMRKRVTLIGCPKLDEGDYTEKLTEILKHNDVKSVMVARMEVPCCGGLEHAVKRALLQSGKMIPWRVVVVTVDGRVLEEQEV